MPLLYPRRNWNNGRRTAESQRPHPPNTRLKMRLIPKQFIIHFKICKKGEKKNRTRTTEKSTFCYFKRSRKCILL
eukprot:jgi/Orpsp1_1/1185407/evm.model.c7180000093611.1